MTLSSQQKQYLKGQAHKLKPVVMVGDAGISDAVVAETDQTLEHHELIKVKLNAGEKADRQVMAQDLCQRTDAELVQLIGRTAILYRAAQKPRITLP